MYVTTSQVGVIVAIFYSFVELIVVFGQCSR